MVSDRFSVLSDEEQARLHELLRKFDTCLDGKLLVGKR